MIFIGTLLNVVDNSGALKAKCIHIYLKHKQAKLGDTILVTLKKVKPHGKLKKGKVMKALLVCSKQPVYYNGGHKIFSHLNCIVLLKNNTETLGSRFKGGIFRKIRNRGIKYLSLITHVF